MTDGTDVALANVMIQTDATLQLPGTLSKTEGSHSRTSPDRKDKAEEVSFLALFSQVLGSGINGTESAPEAQTGEEVVEECCTTMSEVTAGSSQIQAESEKNKNALSELAFAQAAANIDEDTPAEHPGLRLENRDTKIILQTSNEEQPIVQDGVISEKTSEESLIGMHLDDLPEMHAAAAESSPPLTGQETAAQNSAEVLSVSPDPGLTNAEGLVMQRGDNAVRENAQSSAAESIHQIRYTDLSNTTVHITKDGSRLAVTFEPEGLGKLDINLSMDHGMLRAQVQVHDDSVRNLIGNNLQQLIDALAREGLNVGAFEVSLKNNNQPGGYEKRQDGPAGGASEGLMDGPGTFRTPSPAGLVNIFA